MNDRIKDEVVKLEAELSDLNKIYDTLRESYDMLSNKIAPHQAEQCKLESEMDKLKPRKIELEKGLQHLRLVVK